jgi:hypothetical protein
MPVPTTTYARGEICQGCHERRFADIKGAPRNIGLGSARLSL